MNVNYKNKCIHRSLSMNITMIIKYSVSYFCFRFIVQCRLWEIHSFIVIHFRACPYLYIPINLSNIIVMIWLILTNTKITVGRCMFDKSIDTLEPWETFSCSIPPLFTITTIFRTWPIFWPFWPQITGTSWNKNVDI